MKRFKQFLLEKDEHEDGLSKLGLKRNLGSGWGSDRDIDPYKHYKPTQKGPHADTVGNYFKTNGYDEIKSKFDNKRIYTKSKGYVNHTAVIEHDDKKKVIRVTHSRFADNT